VKRKVGHSWRLRETMAEHRMFTTTALVPLLHDRGIDLSASQVHRLVSGTPERLSLHVLSALCDIFACSPADLITTTAQNTGVRKTATGDLPAAPAAVKLRPDQPGSCPTHEPGLHHSRAVPALAPQDLRPLRPARLLRGPLARRARLPHLPRPGTSDPGLLPRLRHRPCTARPAPR
jgi:DNA-binding Xre family transcriptional regulator